MNQNKKTLIIGAGNILLSDEGVGVRIVEKMEQGVPLPPQVTLLDGGTAGYALLDYMSGYERLILIDAVQGGGRPGEIYRLTYDDILREEEFKISGHQISLPEVLTLAKNLGALPETVLFGVEPERMEYSLELSETVTKAVDPVIQAVLKEVTG